MQTYHEVENVGSGEGSQADRDSPHEANSQVGEIFLQACWFRAVTWNFFPNLTAVPAAWRLPAHGTSHVRRIWALRIGWCEWSSWILYILSDSFISTISRDPSYQSRSLNSACAPYSRSQGQPLACPEHTHSALTEHPHTREFPVLVTISSRDHPIPGVGSSIPGGPWKAVLTYSEVQGASCGEKSDHWETSVKRNLGRETLSPSSFLKG